MSRLFFLFSFLFISFSARLSAADSPEEVVHQKAAAVRKGDAATAAKLFEKPKGAKLDPTWLDQLIESSAQEPAPLWCWKTQIEGDAAVVLTAELKRVLDPDPCYLLRVGGEWRILWETTDIEVARGAVPETTMKALESLKGWYEVQKKQLPTEIEQEAHKEWTKAEPPTPAEGRQLLIKVLSKRDPKGGPQPQAK